MKKRKLARSKRRRVEEGALVAAPLNPAPFTMRAVKYHATGNEPTVVFSTNAIQAGPVAVAVPSSGNVSTNWFNVPSFSKD